MKTIKTITKVFNCGDRVVARLCKYSASTLWVLVVTEHASGDEVMINIEQQSLQKAQKLLAEMQKEGDKLCK